MKKNIFKNLLIMGVPVIMITAANAQTIPGFKSDAEKKTWIKNHPAEYQLLLKQSKANTPVAMPVQNNANFNSTTQSADEEIKALKDEIESNKYNPNYDMELALKKLEAVPKIQKGYHRKPSYPAFINSGNLETEEDYRIAKEKWIKNNPEKYNKLQQPKSLSMGKLLNRSGQKSYLKIIDDTFTT